MADVRDTRSEGGPAEVGEAGCDERGKIAACLSSRTRGSRTDSSLSSSYRSPKVSASVARRRQRRTRQDEAARELTAASANSALLASLARTSTDASCPLEPDGTA